MPPGGDRAAGAGQDMLCPFDGAAEMDEFDLDLAWGELAPYGGVELYLPTGREVPGETCDTHNPTCPQTCHPTCPHTCPDTCQNTCPRTCQDTCPHTCPETCHPCVTVAQTHCFTCASGCTHHSGCQTP
jgi:hypothetical protein